jgi:O-antigen/teichoic acid export membrane protein
VSTYPFIIRGVTAGPPDLQPGLSEAKDQTVIHWRFAKNALANLGRGGAAAVVALLLPPVLVRHMTPAAYAVWVLVLQTSAYVSFLNLGLQTAIGRYVAYANQKHDGALRDAVFSTAFAALCGAALLSILCLLVAVLAAPAVFPSVPPALVPQMRLALLIVGFAMALELPASAWNGVFIGLQRFEIPALTVGGARLLSSAGIIAAAIAGRSLVVMAATMATANLLSYLAQYLALRRFASDLSFRPSLIQRSTARELYGYCFGLTIMSFSMLLVSGFDLVVVGHFQFSVVTPYSVAASMIMLISGLLYAIVNVLMPHAATLHAADRPRELGQLVIKSTQLSVLLLVLSGIPILLYAGPIMRVWIGQRYVAAGTPLLQILIVANIIRLIGAPYSVILIAAGQQSYIKISPLAEGISNFAVSIALAFFLGGMGVALGTLFGSFIGIGSHLFYSMGRTKPAVNFSRSKFLISGIVIPFLITFPLWAIAIVSRLKMRIPVLAVALAVLLSLAAAGLFIPQSRDFIKKRLIPILEP